jgi:ubiquitin carboxyl-terminal hydrolase 34
MFKEHMAPYAMLIRLIRLSFELHNAKRGDNQLAPSLIFEKANCMLILLTEVWPAGKLRQQIYDECVQHMQESAPCRTGSIVVLLCFLRHKRRNFQRTLHDDNDFAYLTELHLQELMVRELSIFLREKKASETLSFVTELNNRLEVLYELLLAFPDSLTADSQARLWSSIIANHNLDPVERDRGFQFYISFHPRNPRLRPILEPVFRTFLPQLEPEFFSPNILAFTKNSLEYRKAFPDTGDGKNVGLGTKIVAAPEIEQLWRIILRAADDTLAQDTIAHFTTYHLQLPGTLEEDSPLQTTHSQVLMRCIDQLTKSAAVLSASASPGDDGKIVATARSYDRSLCLLENLVRKFRNRPISGNANLSGSQQLQVLGEPMSIKVRWTTQNSEPMRTIQMGSDTPGKTLLSTLNTMIGGRNRTVLGGVEIKLKDEPEKTLRDFGFVNNCLLQVYHQPDEQQPKSEALGDDGTMTAEVMKHFQALYKLLSLPEPYSMTAWEFLRVFPAHDSIRQRLREDSLSVSDIYPQSEPYRFMYSLHALGNSLENKEDPHRNEFMLQSMPKLIEALVSYDVDVLCGTKSAVLIEALRCLNLIIEDSEIRAQIDDNMFGDPKTFVRFLLNVLKASDDRCDELHDVENCISGAIRALFETSRINLCVRASTFDDVDLKKLVRRYLVDDPRLVVRNSFFDAIKSLGDFIDLDRFSLLSALIIIIT